MLAVGAHPDDVEIGCGGTMLQLVQRHPSVEIRWIVLSGDGERRAEAERSAERMLGRAGLLTLCGFRDGHLPYDDPAAVKAALVEHRTRFEPDVILAPRASDAHQDHRFLGELVWQVHRASTILHYEIPKYEGDLAGTNCYVRLDGADVAAKLEHLEAMFPSQAGKPWFDGELFRGLMRLRGVECRSPSGYAEAFEAPKLILS